MDPRITQQLQEQLGPGLRLNERLAPYTTYAIGGPADYFYTATNSDQLIHAVQAAITCGVPFFHLGGGSNLLISDAGVRGLVIRSVGGVITQVSAGVQIDAGVVLWDAVEWLLQHGYVGFDFLAGIPGSFGGAIRGNAGAYGGELKDILVSVQSITPGGEVIERPVTAIEFGYRHSEFKTNGHVVVRGTIQVPTGDSAATREVIAARVAERASKQPLAQPSAGCVFKNIRFDEVNVDDLQKRGVDIERFQQHKKIPTAYLIESLGLKGVSVGDIQVSPAHANFLVNRGNGRAQDVVDLMARIKNQIQERFGVTVQEEIQMVGFGDQSRPAS